MVEVSKIFRLRLWKLLGVMLICAFQKFASALSNSLHQNGLFANISEETTMTGSPVACCGGPSAVQSSTGGRKEFELSLLSGRGEIDTVVEIY